MKKLLCVLMFGMMFGEEVSQRTIDVTIESGSNTTLDEIFPQYNLEWAIINIVECPTTSGGCFIVRSNWDPDALHKLKEWQNSYGYVAEYSSDFWTNQSQHFDINFGQNGIFTIKLLVTAEFPQEDTGYIEEGFDYCLHIGANLVSSPCRDEVAITDAIPSEITQHLTGIITEGGASTNLNGTWVGSLNGVGGGKGYWILSDMEGCFNYTCSEN